MKIVLALGGNALQSDPKDKRAIIASLSKAKEALKGISGTKIVY